MKTPTITHYSRDVSVRLLHVSMCKSLEGQGLICYTALMAGKKILHKKKYEKKGFTMFYSRSHEQLSSEFITNPHRQKLDKWDARMGHVATSSDRKITL